MNVTPNIAFSDPSIFPTWKHELRKVQASMTIDKLDDVLLPRSGFDVEVITKAVLKNCIRI
ncbi:MAG: hypothetical protein H6696_17485 [Deferribacteres bacterium]|nr:hypothetical protein [Deferribacteres bacterium]